MSQYQNFSSLPPESERQFVVFEQRTKESSKKAMTIGLISGVAFAIAFFVVVFSFEPPENKMKDDDMGMLKRSPKKSEAATPAPPPAAENAPADDSASAGSADTGSADTDSADTDSDDTDSDDTDSDDTDSDDTDSDDTE